MRRILMLLALCAPAFGQNYVRWAATSGDVSLSAAYTVTIQQPATNAQQVELEAIIVYCSVACNVTQAANGAAATSTAGTVTPILPSQLNITPSAKFWTASNVGAGTAQGGIFHLAVGATTAFCLSTSCGATQSVRLGTGGTGNNYSVSISSISGTANITIYGRSY